MAHELASVPCCWSPIRGTSALEGVLQAMTCWRNGCSRNHWFRSCTRLWNGVVFLHLEMTFVVIPGDFFTESSAKSPFEEKSSHHPFWRFGLLWPQSCLFHWANPEYPSCDIRMDVYRYMDIRPYPYPYTYGHLYIYNIYIYIAIRIQRRYAYI